METPSSIIKSSVELYKLLAAKEPPGVIPASLTYEDAWLLVLGLLTPAHRAGNGLAQKDLNWLLDQMLGYAGVKSPHLADSLQELKQLLDQVPLATE